MSPQNQKSHTNRALYKGLFLLFRTFLIKKLSTLFFRQQKKLFLILLVILNGLN